VELRRGDSAYYDAAMGHNVISLSDEDATILWVTSLALIAGFDLAHGPGPGLRLEFPETGAFGRGWMRIAVLTDIHANREAFEAVLADVAAHGVDRIALLGDIVGYGPDPGWCCDKAAAWWPGRDLRAGQSRQCGGRRVRGDVAAGPSRRWTGRATGLGMRRWRSWPGCR
jgi:hypothetical protein